AARRGDQHRLRGRAGGPDRSARLQRLQGRHRRHDRPGRPRPVRHRRPGEHHLPGHHRHPDLRLLAQRRGVQGQAGGPGGVPQADGQRRRVRPPGPLADPGRLHERRGHPLRRRHPLPAQVSEGPVSDEVLVEESDGVAVITINRPKARNAVNGAVARGIAEALDALDDRPEVSAYVLTGAGGPFCAGMDLKGFLTGDMPVVEGRGFGGMTESPPKKPVVAAVAGYALAGGFELALACDLIVASAEAKFGLPEPKRGLVAAAGGVMRLPRRIPYHVAMEIALTGDHYPAARLYELGLVNRVTEPGQALEG